MSTVLNILRESDVQQFLGWMLVLIALGIGGIFMMRRSWLRQTLVVAMVLFVPFSFIYLWIALTTNEDVPDPCWTDYIWAVIVFIMYVPATFLVPDHENITILKEMFVLGTDSFFWGFVGVSLYRILRRYIQKRRFAPPNSLQPTAATPGSCD